LCNTVVQATIGTTVFQTPSLSQSDFSQECTKIITSEEL
jgi:cytosine/uracil/thiamine/allantoin permease